MMSGSVIDRATGAILLTDGYQIFPNQEEEDVAMHFGVPVQPESEWGGAHYFIKSLDPGDWKLHINLTFFQHQLQAVSIYPIIPEELIQRFDGERKGFGPSEKELAMLEMFENWLTEQIETKRKFSWGSVEVLCAPRPDGPGDPMIHLHYK